MQSRKATKRRGPKKPDWEVLDFFIRVWMEFGALVQIVHFHQSNTGGVVYPADDRGVITRRQVCDDRRFPSVSGRVAAV